MAAPGRPSAVDESPHKLDIIRSLLAGRKVSEVSRQFHVSQFSIRNYKQHRLNKYIAAGDPAIAAEQQVIDNREVRAIQDTVLDDVSRIRTNGWALVESMLTPEKIKALDCDVRGTAGILREIRGAAELKARLEGRLQDRSTPQINVVILGAYPILPPAHQVETLRVAAPVDEILEAEYSDITPGA